VLKVFFALVALVQLKAPMQIQKEKAFGLKIPGQVKKG